MPKQQIEKLSKVKHIIAIAAGKGGVGKSTISATIACALAEQGAKVGILDGDIYAPAQPIIFELSQAFMEADTDQHGNTIAFPVEKNGIKIASMGFVLNRTVAWRGNLQGNALNMFLGQIEWGELDYLIVDLPPGMGDVHFNFILQCSPNGVILVTTPHKLSLTSMQHDIELFQQMNAPILGVIENMSDFVNITPQAEKNCLLEKYETSKTAISNFPLLATIPFDAQIAQHCITDAKIFPQSELKENLKSVIKTITAIS